MTEDSRDDHWVHPPSAELGGDGVAYIVQAGVWMHAGLAGKPLERAGERIWVEEESVAAVAHEGDRTAQLVERIAPSGTEARTPLQLFASVPKDPLQGEGGKLNEAT